jgi:hypothetical protein
MKPRYETINDLLAAKRRATKITNLYAHWARSIEWLTLPHWEGRLKAMLHKRSQAKGDRSPFHSETMVEFLALRLRQSHSTNTPNPGSGTWADSRFLRRIAIDS